MNLNFREEGHHQKGAVKLQVLSEGGRRITQVEVLGLSLMERVGTQIDLTNIPGY